MIHTFCIHIDLLCSLYKILKHMFSQSCGIDDSIFTLEYADSVPQLSIAARAGDLDKIRKLISKGRLPQTPDNRGWTAIHCCVAAGQIEALKLILKLKPKSKDHLVNLTTWENVTPLAIALNVPRPSIEMVKILLKAGADPKQCTNTKLSPLHFACLKKLKIDFVKLLVQYGAYVNIQEDLSLSTPLHFAVCEKCDLGVIKFLINLSDLGLKNIHERTAFLEACNCNFLEAVELFLEKDKSLSNLKSGMPPLMYASLVGNLKMVELLIESGANVNRRCKAVIALKSWGSDLILLDKENFLPIHSSLTNVDVFKKLLMLTNPKNLLWLERKYYSFPLFVIIYADEVFYETLLKSDLPFELKTIKSKILTKFILCYPDMEEIIIKKFPLIFKYNFHLNPETVFQDFCSQMTEVSLCRNLKFFNFLAKMGVSFRVNSQEKNSVINALQSLMVECKDAEQLGMIKSICDLILQSVLSLKQYCRIIFRQQIRSSVDNDLIALKMIKDSALPDCLKKFVCYETFK